MLLDSARKLSTVINYVEIQLTEIVDQSSNVDTFIFIKKGHYIGNTE